MILLKMQGVSGSRGVSTKPLLASFICDPDKNKSETDKLVEELRAYLDCDRAIDELRSIFVANEEAW